MGHWGETNLEGDVTFGQNNKKHISYSMCKSTGTRNAEISFRTYSVIIIISIMGHLIRYFDYIDRIPNWYTTFLYVLIDRYQ